MIQTGFLSNCPRCGNITEAWTDDGVTMQVQCRICGYRGRLPASPDLKNGLWRV